MIDIDKAFAGRWRIKSAKWDDPEYNDTAYVGGVVKPLIEHIKDLCRDFFEAGIVLSQRNISLSPVQAIAAEYPNSDDEAFFIDFDRFWDLYDKKVGKPKCEKLWEKLTIAEKKACLAYIPLYKQAQSDKQYRKNPETFLRNKSWNDEIINRNGTDKQSQRNQRFAEVAGRIAEYTKDPK